MAMPAVTLSITNRPTRDRVTASDERAIDVVAPTLSLAGLLRLQNWMSPAFPIGAYTCSHGLESAIADGRVSDATTLRKWIVDVLGHGSGRNDAIVLGASHASVVDHDGGGLEDIAELSLALSAGAERRRESLSLGASFRRAVAPSSAGIDPLAGIDECPLPVAIGALSATAALPPLPVLATALQSTAANLAWIATRLVPLGQSRTLTLLTALEPIVAGLAERAADSTLDDLGGCALLADIDSLRHERLVSRVCRT